MAPSGPQSFSLCLKNMANQVLLVIGFEVDKLCGDREPMTICLRHRSDDSDSSLDRNKRRKKQLQRKLVTDGELTVDRESHPSPLRLTSIGLAIETLDGWLAARAFRMTSRR